VQRIGGVGDAALVLPPLAFLGQAALTGAETALALGAVALVAGVSAAGELDSRPALPGDDARAVVGVVAAAAGVTYVLSDAGAGPVVASALVGIAATAVVPERAVPAYCGSFVGMASPEAVPFATVLLGGVVTGIAFVAVRGSFDGFGGKLGTLALFGCVTAGVLTGAEYGTAPAFLVPPWAVLAVGAAAALLTAVLSEPVGAVGASGLVGLGAGVTFPLVTGPALAATAFCASFVGMSAPERLNAGEIGAAGALAAAVLVAAGPAFAGAGGKLGTVAFVSCLALAGTGELRERVSVRAG